MPPGMRHSFRNVGDEPLTLLVLSSFPENKPFGDHGNNR
jgi:mannose-6-phosphate isomerase-like protein (cupin superfamily)